MWGAGENSGSARGRRRKKSARVEAGGSSPATNKDKSSILTEAGAKVGVAGGREMRRGVEKQNQSQLTTKSNGGITRHRGVSRLSKRDRPLEKWYARSTEHYEERLTSNQSRERKQNGGERDDPGR